jgi:hypothetical protein
MQNSPAPATPPDRLAGLLRRGAKHNDALIRRWAAALLRGTAAAGGAGEPGPTAPAKNAAKIGVF